MADNTYAQLSVVNEAALAKIPKGNVDLIDIAAASGKPLSQNQLLSATGVKSGQTVLVTGAVGNVGRSAVFTAKDRKAKVIAGVLKKQMDQAKTLAPDQIYHDADDDSAIANLAPIDAVADAVSRKTAEKLVGRVKEGGTFTSVLAVPQNAAKYPSVKAVFVSSKFSGRRWVHGRSGAGWQAGDSDQPEAAAE